MPSDLMRALDDVLPLVASLTASEAGTSLPPDLVTAMADAGVFSMTVPASLGGAEVDAATLIEVIERISRADGAAGWVTAIASGTASYVAGMLPGAVAAELFTSPRTVMVGSIAVPNGIATATDGGYRVSGRWPFGSGSLHSQWLASACMVHDADGPRLGPNGKPEQRVVILPAGECDILDTWNVVGLRGTGSNDYAANDVFVPERFTFDRGSRPAQPGPLYQHRFFLFGHPAHALGIARHAIDAFAELAAAKEIPTASQRLADRPAAQAEFARASGLVDSGRAYVDRVVADAWATVAGGANLSPAQQVAARLAMITGVRNAMAAVDLLYEAAGASSIYESSPLARCFRDIHVATQHGAIQTSVYQSIGQRLLDPNTPGPFGI